MDLQHFLDTTLAGLGYELVDFELARNGLMRVFIDKEGGITLDDCVAVSNHLSRVFLVENVDYDRLEISSPGLDRPLKKEVDFVRFAGQQVKIKLRLPLDGKKSVQGELKGIADGAVLVALSAEQTVAVPLTQIDKAKLVPVF
ncbi:ribosome maturation factor RimP [Chitinimonas taiwanensis]|jgi:ribosome maturation factor RimP|uniref:Ribosome maturation factor RimP n=1 Tax=Chitinimonas taiwanensis DSM 18899 TaxID=1121279 RepID=A0A1K2HBE1_9NEIS|nr:ribosome maturation factor RimP [Chitinimonas taiwanensis]SFZ74120.1 ribosome maturation factor RimP [Chitinimonas taiwanensis DSM 18899]